MKTRQITSLALLAGIILLAVCLSARALAAADQTSPAASTTSSHTLDQSNASTSLHSASLMFVENVGQFDPQARFQVRGDNHTLWLAEDALWITLLELSGENEVVGASVPSIQSQKPEIQNRQGVNLKLSFAGANPHPRLEPFNRSSSQVSYFLGSDPTRWRADVPVWGGVRYVDLYPGVDLEITGQEGHWTWRFVCRSNCQFDPRQVTLRVEGADNLVVDGDYLSLMTVVDGLNVPLLQMVTADGIPLDSPNLSPVANDVEIIAPFSPNPVHNLSTSSQDAYRLLYSTFLGGSSQEIANTVAVDRTNDAYVAGITYSSDFPTVPGAFDTDYDGEGFLGDAFVARISADGTGLVYATFLGGGSRDESLSLDVDATGNAYVAGVTRSSDFPTTAGAFDTSKDGDYDAFVVKVNPNGTSLVYATFLGGSSEEGDSTIAADETGSVYLAGYTGSADFPATPGAFDTDLNGSSDAFVVKMNVTATSLDYATFLGGEEGDKGWDIAIDGVGNAYVTGITTSSDFPTTTGAFDTSFADFWCGSYTCSDSFVVKVNPSGTSLAYATFLGGENNDRGRSIAVDVTGNAYVAGITSSSDFPTTTGAFDLNIGGVTDAFVVKLNAAGTELDYATFLGGSGEDYGYDIAGGESGSVYVTGNTASHDFPTTAGALDVSRDGASDVFVVGVNADGTDLAYATFLGGSGEEEGNAIAVNGMEDIYVTGYTWSGDFPTTASAFDTSHNGEGDVFVTQLSLHTYHSVSGQVTDVNGHPLSGVILSDATNHIAVTDDDGIYTFRLVTGTYTLTPAPGYFWSPASRTVTVPPGASGQDFVGRNIEKQVAPVTYQGTVSLGDRLTYTLRLVHPGDGLSAIMPMAVYDRVPTYTQYVSLSLSAPGNVIYDPAANAISGTLSLTPGEPVSVTFVVQVEINATAGPAPLIVNRACFYRPGEGLASCEWSNEVFNYIHVWSIYLPILMR